MAQDSDFLGDYAIVGAIALLVLGVILAAVLN
jgi:hypothetical protein